MFPIGIGALGSVPYRAAGLGLLVGVALLGTLGMIGFRRRAVD